MRQSRFGPVIVAVAASLLWAGCKPPSSQDQRTKADTRGGKTLAAGPKVAERVGIDEDRVPRPEQGGRQPLLRRGSGTPLEKPVEPLAEEEDLPPPHIAEMVFSQQHAQSNLVNVGDPFPALKLTTLDGDEDTVADRLGERGTVVLFWKSDNLYALQELGDLFRDIVRRYGHQGINVAGINVGDTADEARVRTDAAEAKFPQLLDSDGTAFAKLATQYLPRTYLLDGQGKVVWFDLEYSPTTRRQLREAVRKLVQDE